MTPLVELKGISKSFVGVRVLNNIDPKRDVMISDGPYDVLDHASCSVGFGGKMGVVNASIESDIGHVPEAAEGLYWFWCCASPGTTIQDPAFSLDAGPMVIGATYYFPVVAYTLAAGDPRSADEIAALVNEHPYEDGYFPEIGLLPALSSVAVTMTPEPATLALVAGGLLALGVARRRRVRA